MSVTVKFSCGGCSKEVDGTTFMRRHFDSVNGKGYGFGMWHEDTPQDVAPAGWIAFDPYTGCCYCPECWAEIEAPAVHASDCAVHNEPAMPNGPCDCSVR